MRTALFTIAAAASALAFASPASAQWYPQPPGYAYGYHNYGYHNYGFAAAQRMDMRAERLRRHVFNLYQRGLLSPRQGRSLDRQAVLVKQRIWRASRNGLSRAELRVLDRRLDRLERRVRVLVAQNRRYVPRRYGYRW